MPVAAGFAASETARWPVDHAGGGIWELDGEERAERLGGTLQVESAPGAGTRVRVEVPR